MIKKISVEAALNAEMTHHLGYNKNQPKVGSNARNGYSAKMLITGDGPLELRTPRDRGGSFEPLSAIHLNINQSRGYLLELLFLKVMLLGKRGRRLTRNRTWGWYAELSASYK